jgi:hypothetical protein
MSSGCGLDADKTLARRICAAMENMSSKPHNDLLDASDVWLVPRNGRVVFDERGNSSWQWPTEGDPFAEHGLDSMKAADLRIAEPVEIRRSSLPWVYERERPAREFMLTAQSPRFPTTSLHAPTVKRSVR